MSFSSTPELETAIRARARQLKLNNASVYLSILAWNDIIKGDPSLTILADPHGEVPKIRAFEV